MHNIKNYLKELGIQIYEKRRDNFKSFGDNEIFLYCPLELEPFHEILKSFDNHHWVHSKHWWSDTTEEDYPSRHPVLYKNGLILEGTDFNDGRLLWKVEGDEWSRNQQLIIADGLLFALNRKEELVMAEASRDGYKELGRVRLGIDLGRPQHPTIANGRPYIRGTDTVICYKLTE